MRPQPPFSYIKARQMALNPHLVRATRNCSLFFRHSNEFLDQSQELFLLRSF